MLSIMFCACSSDDTDEFQDAVTLNVMNEVNGKTFIGNLDVFLNKNNNFQSESWYIAPAGTLDKETQPGFGLFNTRLPQNLIICIVFMILKVS